MLARPSLLGLLLLQPPLLAAQAGTPATFALHDAAGRSMPARVLAPARLPSGPMLSYPPATVTGSQRYIVLGCRFAGLSGEPATMSTLAGMLGAGYPGLGHYVAEVSGGALSLTGSAATAWADLPQPASYYDVTDPNNAVRIYQDCMGAHDAQVDFSQVDGVAMVLNGEILGAGFFRSFSSQGTIPVTTADGTRSYRLLFIGASAATNRFLWAHGLGHTYDLQHSSGRPLSSINSFWDMMAKGGYVEAGWPGRVPVHPKAVDKVLLGWTPSARAYTATPGSNVVITLERSALPPANTNPVIATIPIGTDQYTLEARRVAGYDRVADSALAGEGVVIHRIVPTRFDPLAEVHDADGNSNPNDAGGYLVVGESFVDSPSRVRVAVVGQTTTGFQVRVCWQATGTGQYGDVNGDGVVNVIDAQIVARFSVGLSVPDLSLAQANGDANADGVVNVIDAQVIVRHAVSLTTAGSQVGEAVTSGC